MKIRSFIKLCAKIYKTKAAKVALLGVCSTMLLVSSGVSFAKYYSENGFDDGASIAKLGQATLRYNYEMNQTPAGLDPKIDFGWHVFMMDFRIEFEESEVARTFDLELRLSKTPSSDYKTYDSAEQTSFFNQNESSSFPTYITKIVNDVGTAYKVSDALSIPSSIEHTYQNEDGETVNETVIFDENSNKSKWDEVSNSGITVFETNKIYFGYVKNESTDIEKEVIEGNTVVKNIKYTWDAVNYSTLINPLDEDTVSKTNIDFITDGKIIGDDIVDGKNEIIYDSELGLEKRTLYFRMLFFSEIKIQMKTEDTKMLYKLTVFQDD